MTVCSVAPCGRRSFNIRRGQAPTLPLPLKLGSPEGSPSQTSPKSKEMRSSEQMCQHKLAYGAQMLTNWSP